jgi:hypothetical protein
MGASSASRKPGRARLSPSIEWHAALPARGYPLSAGTTPRTRWDDPCALCCPHRRLSFLSPAHAMSRAWHLYQKTSSCQRCSASTATANASRGAALKPFCPACSSHPVGGLVTLSASPSLDPVAPQSLGHSESLTRFTTSCPACASLSRSASTLALDVATTARTQCAPTQRPAYRNDDLWALTGIYQSLGLRSA